MWWYHSQVLPKDINWLWCFIHSYNYFFVVVVKCYVVLLFWISSIDVWFSPTQPVKESNKFVFEAHEKYLDMLHWCGSVVCQNCVKAVYRVKANESVTRIYERFHSFFDKLVLVLLHTFVKHLVIPIALGNAATHDARSLNTHQHFVVLEVKYFTLKLKLLGKIRNNQSRHDLSPWVPHLLLH